MTLLDQITESFGASGALASIAAALGLSDSEAGELLGAAGPAMLSRLGDHAADEETAGAVHGLVSADGGSLFETIGSSFGDDHTGRASGLVESIFGSTRTTAEQGVAATSGLDLSIVSRFLPMVAPAIMSLIGKAVTDEGTDAAGLAAMLGGSGTGEVSDDDRAAFLSGLAAVGEVGGLSALAPVGTSSAALATRRAAEEPAAELDAAAVYDYDRSGIGWLIPSLVIFGLLTLGLVLWQCTDNDGDTRAAAVTVIDDEVEPEPEPEPEPETEAEPTIADLAAGTADLSTLVGLVTELGLADTLADPDAGPFTVFAPTNAAFAAAGDTLSRLDGDQVETTVGFHVVPGVVNAVDVVAGAEFDTLAGETLVIGEDGTLPGGVAVAQPDIVAANGVVHIVESVVVPGSIVRSLATSDINELFALEPIQFAVNSSDILPESIPTLDQAVVFLTNVPTGSQFEVQGHTDSDGAEGPNQVLSEARAASVVAYLTDNGVDPALLVPVGYGETQLKVDPDLTAEDKAMNRRIEFVDIS